MKHQSLTKISYASCTYYSSMNSLTETEIQQGYVSKEENVAKEINQ